MWTHIRGPSETAATKFGLVMDYLEFISMIHFQYMGHLRHLLFILCYYFESFKKKKISILSRETGQEDFISF